MRRHLILTIFILVPLQGFSQRTDIEERAMDYYITNIRDRGDKLRSTGRLEIENGNYTGYVMGEYFVCKKRHGKDTTENNFYLNEYKRLGANAKGELDTVDLKNLTVKLKDPIKKTRISKIEGRSSRIFEANVKQHMRRTIQCLFL